MKYVSFSAGRYTVKSMKIISYLLHWCVLLEITILGSEAYTTRATNKVAKIIHLTYHCFLSSTVYVSFMYFYDCASAASLFVVDSILFALVN